VRWQVLVLAPRQGRHAGRPGPGSCSVCERAPTTNVGRSAPGARPMLGSDQQVPEGVMQYKQIYRRSIDEPEAFWAEEAKAIYWHRPPQQILDYSNPPFRRWFVGGLTNLCYNAVDRHLAERAGQLALV